MGTVPVFFTSLKINAAEAYEVPEEAGISLTAIEEKATISGSGTSLTVNVSGKPGRVFYVTFALTEHPGKISEGFPVPTE
ncbi:MAG: hypothetical protein MZV63_48730 [Marinilabiliales bacterium]|nr:hypothetical protein [Marinilabiliales bacterium]